MKTISVTYGLDGKIANISENSLYFEQESKSLTISAALPEEFDSYDVRAYLRDAKNNSTVTEKITKTDGHYDVVVSGEYMSKGTLYAGYELYNADGYIQRLEIIKIAVDSWITLGKGTGGNVYVVTVNVGDVKTLSPGEDAYVTNSGTPKDMILNFGIPQGIKGEKGDKGDTGEQGIQGEKGDTGAAFTYDMFTAEQLALLKGEKGDKGDKGDTGAQGIQGEKGDIGASGYTPQRGVDYYTEEDKQELIGSIEDYVNSGLDGKVDKVSGKGLSSNDFTDALKSKLDDLSNYDDTKIIRLISEEATARSTADEGKVDKVSGKGLSTNDLTDALLERLNNQTFDGIIESRQEGIYDEWMFPDIDNLGTGIYRLIDRSASINYAYHYILFNSREDGSGYRVLFGGCGVIYALENPEDGGMSWGAWQYLSFDDLKEHLNSKQNPHSVTKEQVGLGNVDNTSDVNKPISTAVQTALDGKADKTEVTANDNALKLDIKTLKEKSIPHTTASGYPISLTDHLNDEQVIDYKIYGNSVQDSTPTPDNPVEIQSVGDLVTDTASEHYGKYEVPVKVSGKNLFKYADAEFANAKLIEHILDEDGNKIGAIIQGNSSSNPGTASYTNGWFNPGNLPAKGSICPKLYTGQTVTVSVDYKILEANENFDGRVGLYLSGRNSGVSYTTGVKNVTAGKQYRLSHTYTIKTKSAYEWYPVVTLNSCKVEVKNFQIEFGTANTDYEPYQEPVIEHIYLDEPLRKIGDYADYIDYKNKKVVRNIYKRVFVGTESWQSTSVLFYTPINNISGLSSKGMWCLCNRLIGKTWDEVWSNYKLQDGSYVVGIARSSNALQVTPNQTKPTLDEWKAQLATWNEEGNPFTVWYVDLPREETITVPDLIISNSEASNVLASTSTQPSSIDVTYYQDINKIITELKNAILAQGGNV